MMRVKAFKADLMVRSLKRKVWTDLRAGMYIGWYTCLLGLVCLGCVCAVTGCGRQDAVMVISADRENANAESGGAKERSLQAASEKPDVAGDSSSASNEAASVPKSADSFVYVYVCGCVVSPGVVKLPEGSRAEDALQAAGGFAEDAETSYVNLAAKVTDGERLYFPSKTEDASFLPEQLLGQTEAGNGLVNINTADVKELCTLPGIGEARAESIIAYREANGFFQTKEDIMKVSGIKTGAYEKICEMITVK